MRQFTPTFFPTKGEFNSTDFEQTISDSGLEKMVSNACLQAWQSVKDYTTTESATYRTISSMLHDAFFNRLEMEINQHLPSTNINIYITRSISGNNREYLSVGEYIFIAKLEGSCENKTCLQDTITHQDAEQHIITIRYALDEMRTTITSLSFDYVKQKEILYRKFIPISSPLQSSNINTAQPPQATHPTLKSGQKRQIR